MLAALYVDVMQQCSAFLAGPPRGVTFFRLDFVSNVVCKLNDCCWSVNPIFGELSRAENHLERQGVVSFFPQCGGWIQVAQPESGIRIRFRHQRPPQWHFGTKFFKDLQDGLQVQWYGLARAT